MHIIHNMHHSSPSCSLHWEKLPASAHSQAALTHRLVQRPQAVALVLVELRLVADALVNVRVPFQHQVEEFALRGRALHRLDIRPHCLPHCLGEELLVAALRLVAAAVLVVAVAVAAKSYACGTGVNIGVAVGAVGGLSNAGRWVLSSTWVSSIVQLVDVGAGLGAGVAAGNGDGVSAAGVVVAADDAAGAHASVRLLLPMKDNAGGFGDDVAV